MKINDTPTHVSLTRRMEERSPLEQVRELLETNALPQTTEIAFSCTSGGRGVHVLAWDLRNGAVRKTYKSDCDGEGTHLCMAGVDYLLCALKSKPFILIWRIDKESLHLKVSCSGLVTAMVCHPQGVYCIAALSEKINIWEISSGHLLAQLSRHYQPITTLQFNTTGAFFFSGGKDCLAIAWNLGSVLSDARLTHCKQPQSAPPLLQWREDGQRGSGAALTRHVWSDHSLAVTGIHFSGEGGGVSGRVATCSLDHSCKLYDFSFGAMLCTFLFDAPLSAVILNSSTETLTVATKTGTISIVPLYVTAQKRLNQVSCLESYAQNEYICSMHDHKKSVSALVMAAGGLVSASEDGTCRVWSAGSRQALQVIDHRGGVTGLLVRPDVWEMNTGKMTAKRDERRLPLSAFRKQLLYSSAGGKEENNVVTVLPREGVNPLQVYALEALDKFCGNDTLRESSLLPQRSYLLTDDDGGKDGEIARLKQEMKELKDVHRKLFTLLAGDCLNP